MGDLERQTTRFVHVNKGIRCFVFCKRPSFLVTGGRDKIIRLWNPYVLSKPAGSLVGHATPISMITVNHLAGHIISLSDDKVIKVWNARNLQCLQTLTDKCGHRPENIISFIHFDMSNENLVVGHDRIEVYKLDRQLKKQIVYSHEVPIVAALYNHNFHQVVSACQNGSIRVWSLATGNKTFKFSDHQELAELTSMCFDKIGRRLLTGNRNGVIKMWNFNNGQMLQMMQTTSKLEVTQIEYIEINGNKFIVSVGWDKKISVFLDDSGNMNSEPVRVFPNSEYLFTRGHNDDILCVDFCPPNILATGGVDGQICIWNLETSQFKKSMKEPSVSMRFVTERAVEKVDHMRAMSQFAKQLFS